MGDRNYYTAMFEQIIDQNKALFEAFGTMQDKIETLATKVSVDRLSKKLDMTILAVSENLRDHLVIEHRVTKLETKIA